MGLCIFSLPFQFDIIDELDNEGNLKETYLTIREKENEKENEEENDNEDGEEDEKGKENEDEKGKENEDEKENEKRSLSSEYEKYYNKKIKSINGEYPFTFINNLFKDYKLAYSPQSHYVLSIHLASEINLIQYPLLKEELSDIKIIFENDEELTIDYSITSEKDFETTKLSEYYLKKVNFNIINNIPIQSLESIKKEFKHQNDSNYKKRRKLNDIDWDYSNKGGDIKCKIDHENKKNVLYQSSFNGYYDYKDIMEKCVEEFYSNEYEIIVIYSQNTGGFANLCIPLTQYFLPKISDSIPFSQKDTDLNYEYLEMAALIHETCLPFDREKLYRGKVDDYGNGVIHNRTAEFNMYNKYERKYYEKKINKILETGKIKKPTEIIIFTDGFSFSCGSMFIKGLQVYGSAIVVGYNTKPGIISPKDFDSSQSNSGVKQFSRSDSADNLKDLGFAIPSITNAEQFDPISRKMI